MRALASIAIGPLALALACSSKASSPAPGASATPREATAPAPAPHMKMLTPDIRALPEPAIALPMTESFRLLDAGAAPRAPRRYRWDRDNREAVVEAALRSRRLTAGTWSAALAVPPVREGFGAIVEPAPGGGARLSFRGLTAAVVGPADDDARARADEYLAEFRALIEHRRGTLQLDDRGRITTVAFDDVPAGGGDPRAVDEVWQRWLAAAVPLPEEPVGTGARWRVVTVLRAGAAVVKQTAEYTLVEARPDRWIVDEDIRRIGEDQLVDGHGLPADAIAELIALFRASHGRVELTPASPWPAAGRVTTELRVHAKVGVPGQGVREDLSEDTGTLSFTARVVGAGAARDPQ
jgi:hypothetical protein